MRRAIRWDLIEQNDDQMIKFATAIRVGTASAEAILRRFTRNATHPVYQAMLEVLVAAVEKHRRCSTSAVALVAFSTSYITTPDRCVGVDRAGQCSTSLDCQLRQVLVAAASLRGPNTATPRALQPQRAVRCGHRAQRRFDLYFLIVDVPNDPSPAPDPRMKVEPPICDSHGYHVCYSDLEFLGISKDDIVNFHARAFPLGMTRSRFLQFVSSLEVAAINDGLLHYDIRLKGSSAEFFSGHHKRMVWNRSDVLALFRKEQERLPEPAELAEILATLASVWPSERPTRRPFDALYKARVSLDPSDYDIQISSDELVVRARSKIEELGEAPSDLTVRSRTYNFIRKDIVDSICPHLRIWMITQRAVLRRLVTIAAFPSAGPPNTEALAGPLSSHFREHDWILLAKKDGT